MMQELRVEKLECRLPLTAGLLDSAAYVDQEVPHFQMNVLEGSRVERQIAFDIPWEYVHRDSQVLLDFSVQGSTETVSNIEVSGINARQVVHQNIRDGLSPLVSKAMGMMKETGLAAFDVLEPAVQISNISQSLNLDGHNVESSGPTGPISADSAVYQTQSDQSARAYALFDAGLGVPQVAGFNNLVAPAPLGEYAEEAWENITAFGPAGITEHADSRLSESGFQYLDLQAGSGELLQNGDYVSYHSINWQVDVGGSMSNYGTGWSSHIVGSEQTTKIIDEVFAGMRVGGRRAVAIPADYDWGDIHPVDPPDGTVLGVIEVLGIDADFGYSAPDSWLPKPAVGQPVESVSAGPQHLPQIFPKRTPSGLIFYDTHVGQGPAATDGQTLTVHYVAYRENGEIYDSSRARGEPFTFKLGAGEVIQGWEEGLRGMSLGSRRTLNIPPSLAYEDRGIGETIWLVELLEIDGIAASETESSTTQNFQDFIRDPLPLSRNTYTELNFVTRFTATLTFDVTGNVGDFSEITLTVNPNDSISFAEQIELGSLNIVDSFVIESEGNEAVTRTIDGGVSVAGRPLMMGGNRVPERFNGWSIIGAEAVDGENVVFARRGNGTMHRLVADANWALHGFSSIRNMHNAVLHREARLAGSSSLPQLFAGPPDSVHLWSSVASQMLADGIITADVADCITHSHTLSQQTAPAADTYISADELQAAAPTRMYAFELPVSSPTQTFNLTNGGGAGVDAGGQVRFFDLNNDYINYLANYSPPPDHLIALTLYEWDLTAAGSAEGELASLLELITEHAVTLADDSDNQHFAAVGDRLDCDYVVFHNTLAPIASLYGRAIGNTAGSAGNATVGTAGSGWGRQQLNTVTTSYWPSTSGEQNLALAYTKSETLLRIFQWRPLLFS
jgi:FKBP-type peptidyl-prolyl cis-trans isomerase